MTLSRWGIGFGRGSTELCAVQFVLWVWSPQVQWPCGRFDLWEALLSWDQADRLAFGRWVSSPWWCLNEEPSAQGSKLQ